MQTILNQKRHEFSGRQEVKTGSSLLTLFPFLLSEVFAPAGKLIRCSNHSLPFNGLNRPAPSFS